MNSLSIPWMAEIGLISWRTVSKEKRPPLPSELLATFVIFGAFSLVSVSQPEIGSVLGWGIVVATLLNFWNPADPTHKKIADNNPTTTAPTLQYGRPS